MYATYLGKIYDPEHHEFSLKLHILSMLENYV